MCSTSMGHCRAVAAPFGEALEAWLGLEIECSIDSSPSGSENKSRESSCNNGITVRCPLPPPSFKKGEIPVSILKSELRVFNFVKIASGNSRVSKLGQTIDRLWYHLVISPSISLSGSRSHFHSRGGAVVFLWHDVASRWKGCWQEVLEDTSEEGRQGDHRSSGLDAREARANPEQADQLLEKGNERKLAVWR